MYTRTIIKEREKSKRIILKTHRWRLLLNTYLYFYIEKVVANNIVLIGMYMENYKHIKYSATAVKEKVSSIFVL